MTRLRKTKDKQLRQGGRRGARQSRAKRRKRQMKASFHLPLSALDFAALRAAKFRAAPTSLDWLSFVFLSRVKRISRPTACLKLFLELSIRILKLQSRIMSKRLRHGTDVAYISFKNMGEPKAFALSLRRYKAPALQYSAGLPYTRKQSQQPKKSVWNSGRNLIINHINPIF